MIKCAICGLGRIASTLEKDGKREKPATHAGAIAIHPEAQLVCGCDPSEEKRTAFSHDWKVAPERIYESLFQMLGNEKIDILHIASPPEAHFENIKEALSCDIPVIILEKPVADTIEATRKTAALISESSTIVMVNHERRFSLQYRHIKEVITSEKYGRFLSLNARLYMGRKRKLRDMLFDDGTHMIDLIHFLCGSELHISHVSKNQKVTHFYTSGFCGEVPVLFECASERDHLLFELDLSFETGRIRVGNGYYHEYESVPSPYYESFRSLMEQNVTFKRSEYFIQMFNEAVRLFRHRDANPVSSVEDGRKALEVIEKIVTF